ncbi:MAG: right-handed parallel beta-helix repeat-containing protein [Candidatus Bathyarchaeia archaeon]
MKFQKAVVGLLLLIFVCSAFKANMKSASGEFSVSQKDIFVPRDYPTIQEAINAAQENSGIWVSASVYNEHIVINKSISLIGENRETTIINGSNPGKNVVLVEANNVYISGFTIQHGDSGIFLNSVGNCVIRGNNVKNNTNGIFVNSSWNCYVEKNNVVNNTQRGIFFSYSENFAILQNNVTVNFKSYGYGINLNVSKNCVISRNVVKNYYWDGLGLETSLNCEVTLNTVENIGFRGIWLDKSNNSVIYHNNFINNHLQAVVLNSYGISWDAGYPGGGNYWSDYVGVDAKSGPAQDQIGSDAIGDKAYTKDAYDRYPLIKPISFFNLGVWNNQEYFATTVSNSTINSFNFSPEEKMISFTVEGAENTKGFCRVGIPRDVLWVNAVEDWRVLLDYVEDITVNCRVYENEEFTYIYIPYNHTTHIIQVKGTGAIPEFSMRYFLALLMPLTAITMVLKKKRNSRFS